jgi:sugar phosphate permease
MYPALATRGACVPRSGEAPAPPPPTAHAVLTGAADHETGMLSGLNTTGHEIGGSLGIAILATVAAGTAGPAATAGLADGIGDAFLVAAIIASAASAAALFILPSARTFLPKLALAPHVAVH